MNWSVNPNKIKDFYEYVDAENSEIAEFPKATGNKQNNSDGSKN